MDIENEEFLLFLRCATQSNLRYMCIGGYAVNYYGYHRSTEDMDIWIAPTNENKTCFLNTLQCMGYSESELHVIDILTIIHKDVNFDEAEKNAIKHPISDEIKMNLIPYDFLKEVKLRSRRQKDLFDIARLEEIRNLKK